jgi:hypothetical protein
MILATLGQSKKEKARGKSVTSQNCAFSDFRLLWLPSPLSIIKLEQQHFRGNNLHFHKFGSKSIVEMKPKVKILRK